MQTNDTIKQNNKNDKKTQFPLKAISQAKSRLFSTLVLIKYL